MGGKRNRSLSRNWIILSLIFLVWSFLFCLPLHKLHAAGTAILSIPDIAPRSLPPRPKIIPNLLPDQNYSGIYQKALQSYEQGDYEQAVVLLKPLTLKYDDEGEAWYLMGVCECAAGDYDRAATSFYTAAVVGYEPVDAYKELGSALFENAYQSAARGDYREAVANYKTAFLYDIDPIIIQNAVYSYLNYAAQFEAPENTAYTLYAYDFLKSALPAIPPEETDKDQNTNLFYTIGIDLSRYILEPPQYALMNRAGSCLREALVMRDDPYLHQSLGFIYLYQNSPNLARQEFKKVVDQYPDSPYYELCFERYQDTGIAVYQYRAKYTIDVSSEHAAALLSLQADLTVQIPQDYEYQSTRNFNVLFNNEKIPYSLITDCYGTKYLNLKLKSVFENGSNELTISCEAEVLSKHIPPSSLPRFTIADYNSANSKYRILTRSTPLIDTTGPQIQKMIKEIRQKAGSSYVSDLTRAVYDYVIEKMQYESTAIERSGVSTARALSDLENAICEDYAVLSVTLLRAMKIPASYYSGDTYRRDTGHAWVVIYTPAFQVLPLDPTWGDTSEMPDLYIFNHSNLHITLSFGCDSDLWPEAASIRLSTRSDRGVSAELGPSTVTITKKE